MLLDPEYYTIAYSFLHSAHDFVNSPLFTKGLPSMDYSHLAQIEIL